jgi:hypothetical protein
MGGELSVMGLQGLKPFSFRASNVAAEAATHKDYSWDGGEHYRRVAILSLQFWDLWVRALALTKVADNKGASESVWQLRNPCGSWL